MARLRDIAPALRRVGPFTFLKRVWKEVGDDNCFMLASSMAYAWLFAIFPFIVFLLSLLPYMPSHSKISITKFLQEKLPEYLPKQAHIFTDSIQGFLDAPQGGALSIGLLVTVWAASGGMATTMSALDSAFEVKKRAPFYKARPLAVLLTVVVTLMILAVTVLVPIGSFIVTFADEYGAKVLGYFHLSLKLLAPILITWNILRFSLSFMLLFMVIAVIYTWGSSLRPKFRFITPGAVFCVVVWVLLGATFHTYIDRFGKTYKTYGTVGGVAILLLFFYIDSLVLLIGAEINSEIDKTLAVDESAEPAVIVEEPTKPLSI